MRRAQSGDTSVWDEWFDAYYAPLFRYAYIRLHKRPEAEDIVAQVFTEAYRGIDRYTYTGKPILAWLYRIAHNLVYDKKQADARQADITQPDAEPIGTSPEENLVNLDLINAIETLADEQREVITLRYLLSMSAQEVADIMGKTPTAVFSLQARGLVNLRKQLGEGYTL